MLPSIFCREIVFISNPGVLYVCNGVLSTNQVMSQPSGFNKGHLKEDYRPTNLKDLLCRMTFVLNVVDLIFDVSLLCNLSVVFLKKKTLNKSLCNSMFCRILCLC